MQLYPGIFGGELPLGLGLFGIPFRLPGTDFSH